MILFWKKVLQVSFLPKVHKSVHVILKKMVTWVVFNPKRFLLSIEKIVIRVVSFVDSEIKVFILNL